MSLFEADEAVLVISAPTVSQATLSSQSLLSCCPSPRPDQESKYKEFTPLPVFKQSHVKYSIKTTVNNVIIAMYGVRWALDLSE